MRLRHPNPRAGRPYVRSDKYLLVSRAVLELLPESGQGLTAEQLVARLSQVLPIELFPTIASIRWFMTAVRIDLEARGRIQRVGSRRPARHLARPGAQDAGETATRSILIPDWSGPDVYDFPRRRVG
jgi:Family of unknown function (DUF6958)